MYYNEDKLRFGQKIQEYRKKNHLTQAMLAEKVGVNEKQISRIESGFNYPNLNTFIKMLSILDMQLSDFNIDAETPKDEHYDELIYILKNSDKHELKLYLDVIRSIKQNIRNTKIV